MKQRPGYTVPVVPVVFGDLGRFVAVRKHLMRAKIISKRAAEYFIANGQRETLCASVRIIKTMQCNIFGW